jgi:hypothetical protein
MKKLILKTSIFVASLALLYTLLLLLPPTPRSLKNPLFGAIKKDSLLRNVPSPRIIFVGGSSLNFGLNSQIIKDSLHINPINTAINGSLGLKYILKNTMKYVREGDIIVLVPEYLFFYNDWNRSSQELFRTIVEVNKSFAELLEYTCMEYSGYYIATKFNIHERLRIEKSDTLDFYSANSFNEFGDTDAHWTLDYRDYADDIKDIETDLADYNPKVIANIKKIACELEERGCTLLISYPSYRESSFNKEKEVVAKVAEEFHAHGFTVLGTPERYLMPDSLLFDRIYHLNKQGVDLRTQLLIEDLKPFVASPPPPSPADTTSTTPSPPPHTTDREP